MAVNLLNWRSQTELVNKQVSPNTFLLNTFFKRNTKSHTAIRVDIEIVESGTKNLGHIRNSNAPAYAVGKRDRKKKTITLPEQAETKPMSVDDLSEQVGPGQNPYDASNSAIATAFNEAVALETQDLRDRQNRLYELMSAQALQGKIAVKQPSVGVDIELDFEFENGTHIDTLSGADLWDANGVKILDQIRQRKQEVSARSGAAVRHLVLGSDASTALLNDTAMFEQLKAANFRIGQVDLNSDSMVGVTYLGRIAGIDLWEYSQDYLDEATGNVTPMIAADKAIFIAPSKNQRYHKGPIFRNGGIQSYSEYFSRLRQVYNPDGLELEVASRGLPAVQNPDDILVLTVL